MSFDFETMIGFEVFKQSEQTFSEYVSTSDRVFFVSFKLTNRANM